MRFSKLHPKLKIYLKYRVYSFFFSNKLNNAFEKLQDEHLKINYGFKDKWNVHEDYVSE